MTPPRRLLNPDRPFRTGLLLGLCHALLFGLAFPPMNLWPLAYVAVAPLMVCAAIYAAPSTARSRRREPTDARSPRPAEETVNPAAPPARSRARSARLALGVWLGVLPMWALHEAWLIDVTIAGYPLLAMYLSLWPAAFVWILARLRSGAMRAHEPLWWLLPPLVWTGLEALRAEVALTGYPWFLLAQPLTRPLSWASPSPVLFLASLIGATGVTLLIACVQTPLAWALSRPPRARWVGAGAAALIAGVLAAGFLGDVLGRPAHANDSPVTRIGLVQTNVPQDNKLGWSPARRREDFREFARLTRALAGAGLPLDVVVWPETMFPGEGLDPEVVAAMREAGLRYRETDDALTAFADDLLALQRDIGAPMLVGSIGYEGFRIDMRRDDPFAHEAKFNSVFLIDDGAVAPTRYDKAHLTPFGEVMPYISRWPELERALLDIGARGMRFDLDAGGEPVVFRVPAGEDPLRVVTPICFEATMPRVMRDLVRTEGPRPGVIVHLTNDGWFGRFPGGREQHAQLARLRAIELGTPVVRVANTGISVAFDRVGRRVDLLPVANGPERSTPLLPARTQGAAIAEIRPAQEGRSTLYARTGDVLGPLATAMALAAILLALLPSRREQAEAD